MEQNHEYPDEEHPKYQWSRINKRDLKIGCGVILGFILFVASCGLPGLLNSKRSELQNTAKETLRAFGEIQLAYSQVNLDGYYGSWNALKKTGYIPEDYTEEGIIEKYSLFININNPAQPNGRMGVTGGYLYRGFTAVAFPRFTSPPGYLATFVIREDQTLRVYRPETSKVNAWGDDDDFGARTWERVRDFFPF